MAVLSAIVRPIQQEGHKRFLSVLECVLCFGIGAPCSDAPERMGEAPALRQSTRETEPMDRLDGQKSGKTTKTPPPFFWDF